MSFADHLFGASVDFPNVEDNVDQKRHIELLIEVCEEPKKMLDYHHRIVDDYANLDSGLKGRKEQADKLRLEGNEKFSKEAYTEALQCYWEALKLCPNDAKLHSNSSLCKIKSEQFEQAVVDAFSAFYLDKYWPKPYVMMMSSYALLGYPDIAAQYATLVAKRFGLHHANELRDQLFKLKEIKKWTTQKAFDRSDLNATFGRLFSNTDQHELHTVIFLLAHLAQHTELGSDGLVNIEIAFERANFCNRLLQIPLLKKLFVANVDPTQLTSYEAFAMMLSMRLLGPTLSKTIPPELIEFISHFGSYWTKTSTAKLLAADRIPHGEKLLDYSCKLLICIASERTRERIYKSTSPTLNEPDWLLRMPIACFEMMNPTKNADLLEGLIRMIVIMSTQKWFGALIEKLPKERIEKMLRLYASFGIVCDRLLDYPLSKFADEDDDEDENDDEDSPSIDALYHQFWNMFTRNESLYRIAAKIPEIWLMFARHLAKNTRDPGESAYAIMAMEHLLSPWMFCGMQPIENCFGDGPWFDMLIFSLSKLIFPPKKYRYCIISAVEVTAALATASEKFLNRLAEHVTLVKVRKIFDYGLSDADSFHLLAVVLQGMNDEAILKAAVAETENFNDLLLHVGFTLGNADPKDRKQAYDAHELYHATFSLNLILKCVLRCEKSDKSDKDEAAGKLRSMTSDCLDKFYSKQSEIEKFCNDLISFATISEKGNSQRRKNSGRRKNKAKKQRDHRDKWVPLALTRRCVENVFQSLSLFDNKWKTVIAEVANKNRFQLPTSNS